MDNAETKLTKLITKQAVCHSLANAIMRLGKGDWEGVLWNIDKAREQFVTYRNEQRDIRALAKALANDTTENHESRTTTRPSSPSCGEGGYDS